MRQIELKLKKKEEQLKIKEAILNDSTSEKTKLLDRLFKAETRNLELENTVKTLYKVVGLIFVWFGLGLVLYPVVYSFVDGES
jgi:hypothetical protein